MLAPCNTNQFKVSGSKFPVWNSRFGVTRYSTGAVATAFSWVVFKAADSKCLSIHETVNGGFRVPGSGIQDSGFRLGNSEIGTRNAKLRTGTPFAVVAIPWPLEFENRTEAVLFVMRLELSGRFHDSWLTGE